MSHVQKIWRRLAPVFCLAAPLCAAPAAAQQTRSPAPDDLYKANKDTTLITMAGNSMDALKDSCFQAFRGTYGFSVRGASRMKVTAFDNTAQRSFTGWVPVLDLTPAPAGTSENDCTATFKAPAAPAPSTTLTTPRQPASPAPDSKFMGTFYGTGTRSAKVQKNPVANEEVITTAGPGSCFFVYKDGGSDKFYKVEGRTTDGGYGDSFIYTGYVLRNSIQPLPGRHSLDRCRITR